MRALPGEYPQGNGAGYLLPCRRVIARISGTVLERNLDGSCVVDVGGVGYEVFVPLGRLGHVKPGERATLQVHTHVREDSFVLYGFPTHEDRTAFRTVLGVSGIGPKLALAILSVLDADRLSQAVAREDKHAFRGISGVGKKTVDRLMLELKDKLPRALGTSTAFTSLPAEAVTASAGAEGPVGLVTNALIQMGFKPAEAQRAVGSLGEPQERPVEVLLREALAQLG